MPSTPLIASSIGVATVSAITLGLAPGYCARTTTEGGTTSGYSEIGITGSASAPIRRITIDRTPAKIGRSIKNLDRFIAFSREGVLKLLDFCCWALPPRWDGRGLGKDECPKKPYRCVSSALSIGTSVGLTSAPG